MKQDMLKYFNSLFLCLHSLVVRDMNNPFLYVLWDEEQQSQVEGERTVLSLQ